MMLTELASSGVNQLFGSSNKEWERITGSSHYISCDFLRVNETLVTNSSVCEYGSQLHLFSQTQRFSTLDRGVPSSLDEVKTVIA